MFPSRHRRKLDPRLKYLLGAILFILAAMRFEWAEELTIALEDIIRPFGGTIKHHSPPLMSGDTTIIDGDTIIIEVDHHKTRIRLFGIDAPESGQRCIDQVGQQYLCGRRATEALASLIAGSPIVCDVRSIDRYQRSVAECRTKDDVDLSVAMVRAGWAIDYEQYSRGRFSREQREAQLNKRVLWAGTFQPPSEWRNSKR